MPRRSSRNLQTCFCSNTYQSRAAAFVIGIPAWYPWLAWVTERDIIKPYSLPMLRLVYICPALSIVASVFTVVAYCKRISPGYIIALILNGTSLFGWFVAMHWLIITWSRTSGYFANLDSYAFCMLLAQFFIHICLALMFEAMLYWAYIDSKREARSLNSIDRPLVPETSMNTGSAENEHSNES